MKRMLLFIAIAGVSFGLASPVHALPTTNEVAQNLSTTNDVLNQIPGFGGDSTRHACVIDETIDRSICVYVPLP